HRDPDGDAEKVGVLELHAGALVAVVEQRLEASLPARVVDGLRGLLGGIVAPDRDHVDVEGRDRPGPDDAVSVRQLLDGRGRDARGADAVAAHHDRALLAGLIEVLRSERLREPRPELEDIADLDDALDRERRAALRTRFARLRRVEVGEATLEVAAGRDPA